MNEVTLTPAATLVLISRTSPNISVLLLQRAPTLKAFPSVWAFPGGRVDAVDRDVQWLKRLCPPAPVLGQIMRLRDADPLSVNTKDYLQRMQIEASEPKTWLVERNPLELWSYWVAATRECYEETGLSLAGWGQSGRLDFSSFYYLGRLVPPPQVAYRFDTRFFAALVDPTPVILRVEEATAYRWIEVSQALVELTVANPTRYVLERLSQWGTVAALENICGKDGGQWST